MRVAFGGVLITMALAACGGGSDTTGPPPHQSVTRVEIDPPKTDNFRPGMTVQLTATAYDGEGSIVTGRPISWSSSSPTIATVSPDGLLAAVEGSGFGTGFIIVTASVDGIAGTANIWFDAWSFSQTIDPVNGSQFTEAVRHELNFRCTAGHLETFIRASGVTASGAVEYRLDNRASRSESWNESTNFRALFYPGDVHQFARDVAASDSLVFRYSLFTGGTPLVRIDLFRGLAPYLTRLFAACP